MCMCTTKTFTAQLHNNISHRLIHVLGPDLPGVWYSGRGHVWEECGGSMLMWFYVDVVQAMLEAVYAVWVCFWLQYVLK